MNTPIFPFTAIVGQEQFKKALILNLIDPSIGGVLAIGDKGTGKTTLIRSLADLMEDNNNFPFVNLPLGVTEDRLIGNINLETLINEKKEVIKSGLLNKANKGILYVDEVNLLQAHLMDVLLDASASGRYYLEREGVSHILESRFCLVGSMNPEEGELRPQLKDRFGLGVEVITTTSLTERAAVVKARMAFDADPEKFRNSYQKQQNYLLGSIRKAQKAIVRVKVSGEMIDYCSNLAMQYGVEGLRADILLIKTAKANAALEGKGSVSQKEVDDIADLVLFHRKKLIPSNQNEDNQSNEQQEREQEFEGDNSTQDDKDVKIPLNDFKRSTIDKKKEGKLRQKQNLTGEKSTDVKKTVGQYLATDKFQMHHQRKQKELKEHYIFLLDASGSMLSNQINAYAKGAVEQIAITNKTQKTTYSMVTLTDNDAVILINSNPILQQLEETLKSLETGGKTNLKAGLKKVKQLTTDPDCVHHLCMVTDGKFSGGGSIGEHVLAFNTLCKGLDSVSVVDAEQGVVKLGMAKAFATEIRADYEVLKIEQ